MKPKTERRSEKLPRPAPGVDQVAVQRLVAESWRLQQSGQLSLARAGYLRALSLDPTQPDALHMLGLLAHEQRAFSTAVEYFERALRTVPKHPAVHSNFGLTLQAMGRLDDAGTHFRKAIAEKPDFAAAHLNLGILLKSQQRVAEAIECYGRAIHCNPRLAAAYYNRAIALQESDQLTEAVADYSQALALRPSYASALANRGHVRHRLGQLAESLQDYESALQLRPDSVEYHCERGAILRELGRFDDALVALNRAASLNPNDAAAYFVRPLVLLALRRFTEALTDARQAIALAPNRPAVHVTEATILISMDRLPEAKDSLSRALSLDSEDARAGELLLWVLQQLADWAGLDAAMVRYLQTAGASTLSPFMTVSLPGITAKAQREAAFAHAKMLIGRLTELPLVSPATCRNRERLRIGYLSADIHNHATVYLIAGVLEKHDRSKFEISTYSYGPPVDDPGRQRIVAACEHFRDLSSLSDNDAAIVIARDEIDILVDLKGYTKDSRLGITARRPAPIVVSWLGYPGTLGHPVLADYIIGDATVTPVEHAEHFSEVLALMPHCYQPNDAGRIVPTAPTRAAVGLPENAFVFCSLNQAYKILPETFSLWCRLLIDNPGSVLWLLGKSGVAQSNLCDEARNRGVEADRLIFAPVVPQGDHLARLQLADLALDTFPCTSHTTASDALWAGVPLVTRIGETFASRVAASLLRAVGLPELVTQDADAYFALANGLASDPVALGSLRSRLALSRRSSPLFDTEGFARDLEDLFSQMWERHAVGDRRAIVGRRAAE